MKKVKMRRKIEIIFLGSMILLTSIYVFLPMNFSSSLSDDLKEEFTDGDDFKQIDSFNKPKLSIFGDAPWWDASFEYRMLINVTNPYSYNFNNFGVSLTFNYQELVQAGKIQSDLDDIRIIEKNYLRKYYVQKDYPSQNLVTVWFDNNVSATETETDTYLYFGNTAATNQEAVDYTESFGWIKNGDFELDISLGDKFEPYGWTFSHNPVNLIKGISNPNPNPYNSSTDSYQFFVNKLISTPQGAERIAHGSYAYKFGALNPTLPDGTVNDYAGTFFSYPFTVPYVDGGISLVFYRNIRTYRFERPKNMGLINDDGYFVRFLNGSAAHYDINPDNHDDSDISPTFQNYVEAFDGYAYYNVPAKKWNDPTLLIDFPDHITTKDTLSDSGSNGDLTGYIEFDLTDYMGKEIFFEIGVWGDESNEDKKEKSAFFQLDDLKFNYSINTVINEVQARKSDIKVIARDVDGRIVPNAEIIVINETSKTVVDSGYTAVSSGSITFTHLLNGEYNITAYYSMGSQKAYVGSIVVNFSGKAYIVELILNLWTIDFEVVDWDGNPLNYGFIELSESLGGLILQNLTLNTYGKATFRWLNITRYYFKIYYDNEDYSENLFVLNESYIYRHQYDKVGEKYRQHVYDVNEINKAPNGAQRYYVNEYIYTNGSLTELGSKKIIKANITLSNLNDQITNISIYYINKNNSTGSGDENLIYFEDGYGFEDDTDFIELDIPLIENAKLLSEKYEVYGLSIIVNGFNSSICNGIISVDLIETCNVFNRTSLARLNIRVININTLFPEGAPVDALVKIFDNKTGKPLINLTSYSTKDGYAYGVTNDIPFWFLKDRLYTFSIDIVNLTNVFFNVTQMLPENQWRPTSKDGVKTYNYTLYYQSSITLNIIFKQDFNLTMYDTTFFNASGTEDVFWGEIMRYSIVFNYTNDGENWNYVTSPSSTCTVSIKEVGSSINLIVGKMTKIGQGNFTFTLNSNLLSAGGSNKFYYVKIEGSYPGYPAPNPETFLVKVKSIPTQIGVYDYESLLELQDQSLSTYYDELVNITIRYSILESGLPLEGATLTYRWIGLTPIYIESDSLNDGYYTFTLDTSDAQSTGIKIISITASYENYTTKSNFLVFLNILERKTTLNDETGLVYLNPKVNVQDPKPFIFIYRDANTLNIVGDLTIASYTWQELDENGNIIPDREGSGSLTQNANKTYTLDFKTELRSVGYYFIYVTLQKENYEAKSALINLEIQLREFYVDIANIKGKSVKVTQGENIEFVVNLIDLSRNNQTLENASVVLQTKGNIYHFNETSPGIYMLTFKANNIDAFFAPNTFSGIIKIQKTNFTTQEIYITITVKMEEIFPGMPTFYFILITSAIAGVAISLIAYRVIQQARIPGFVKKIRKVKNVIKSKKVITESYSIPTKEEMTAKLFGAEWKEIEMSLDDILGISELKSRKTPINDKISKDGGVIE